MVVYRKVHYRKPEKTHLRAGAVHEAWVGAESDFLWGHNGLKLLGCHGPKM